MHRGLLPQIPPSPAICQWAHHAARRGRKAQVNKAAGPPGALAQLKIAKQAVEAIDQLQSQGQPASPEVHHRWSLRLLESKRAISPTKVEEIAALEEYNARTKKLMESSLGLYKAGQLSLLQYLETEYWHNEALSWLEKAKDEAHDPARR